MSRPDTSPSSFTPPPPNTPPSQLPTDGGEHEAARGNGGGSPGLDLTRLFTPPSTTTPFGGLAQQLSSFFIKLLKPEEGGGDKKPQPLPKGGKPRRRTGGPVSVVFGATGRAGREIVTALLAAGYDVVAVRCGLCGGVRPHWEKKQEKTTVATGSIAFPSLHQSMHPIRQAVRNETKLADVFGAEMLESSVPLQEGQGLLDWVSGSFSYMLGRRTHAYIHPFLRIHAYIHPSI